MVVMRARLCFVLRDRDDRSRVMPPARSLLNFQTTWLRCVVAVLGALAIGSSVAPPVRSQTETDTIPIDPDTSTNPDAVTVQEMFLFQDLVLASAFTPDPQYLRGIAGGTEAAASTAGIERTPTGRCVGTVNTLPNHRIYLEDFFESLRVRAISEGDTTIVVRGPGGTWCNDDYDGNNAGIAGQWLPGAYEIWVGSYEADTFAPYELEFSEVILPQSTRDRPAIFRR